MEIIRPEYFDREEEVTTLGSAERFWGIMGVGILCEDGKITGYIMEGETDEKAE